MKRAIHLSLLALALLFCITSTGFALEYKVTKILSGDVSAEDINDLGQVVCKTGCSGILWENGEIIRHFGNSEGRFSVPTAINNQGQVTGVDPFIWDAHSGDDVSWLYPYIEVYDGNYALDINEANQIVGHISNQATIWENGGFRFLAATGSWATGINDLGHIAGYASDVSGYIRPCVWVDGTPTYLSDQRGVACDINNKGQVAGAIEMTPGKFKVVMWDNGVMHDTGMRMDDGVLRIRINDLGQVTCYTKDITSSFGPQHACVWQDGRLTMLPDFDGRYSVAFGINNLGQIVGIATDDTGDYAVLWEPVPEPSSILALISGLGGLGLAARRRARGV